MVLRMRSKLSGRTITPFAGHWRKVRIHLHLSTINNVKTRSFAPRCIHLRKDYFQDVWIIAIVSNCIFRQFVWNWKPLLNFLAHPTKWRPKSQGGGGDTPLNLGVCCWVPGNLRAAFFPDRIALRTNSVAVFRSGPAPCSAPTLPFWNRVSRLKRHNFANLFQRKWWNRYPAPECETQLTFKSEMACLRKHVAGPERSTATLFVRSAILTGNKKAALIPTVFQSRNGQKYTLFQTETMICRLREAKTIPCWAAHPRIANILEQCGVLLYYSTNVTPTSQTIFRYPWGFEIAGFYGIHGAILLFKSPCFPVHATFIGPIVFLDY